MMIRQYRRTISIDKKAVLIFALLFPHMKPNYLSALSAFLDSAFDAGRAISTIIVLYLLIYVYRKNPSPPMWILIALECWSMVVTLFCRPGSMRAALVLAASSCAFAILVELFVDSPDSLLAGFQTAYELAIYLNFITVLKYPGGIPSYGVDSYFLGLDNVAILYIIPGICIAFLRGMRTKHWARSFLLIAIAYATVIRCWAATSVMAVIGLSALILFTALFRKSVSPRMIWIASVALSLFFLLLYSAGQYSFLDKIITNFLGKSTSLTGRIDIWEKAIKMIQKSPVIGYGMQAKIPTRYVIADHAHNQILQQLLVGGIPQLLLFVALNISVIEKLNKFPRNKYTMIITATLFGIYITFATEAYAQFWRFYIVYFFAYHADSFFESSPVRRDYGQTPQRT